MNNSASSTPAVTSVPQIRNERGQFAPQLTTPATLVNQQAVNAATSHWVWLYAHGYDVQPNELFASARVNWRGGGQA